MTLYVYDPETLIIVAEFEGGTNQECEAKAADGYSDTDRYAWTYTPGFGANDGLRYAGEEHNERTKTQ